MSVECCECKGAMGHKEGEGVSHGICVGCMRKNHPGAFAFMRERQAMARGAELLAKADAALGMDAMARISSWDFKSLMV